MIADALLLSLGVAGSATFLAGVLGTLAGRWLARTKFRGREAVDALLMLPLVLPPTVTGYYLLVLFGASGPLAALRIPFTWTACTIAATVMALPLMVRAARTAFEEIDIRHEWIARSLGLTRGATFLQICLPLARRGLIAGLVLSFARALGEFGATLVLAGNVPGRTQTLPLAIYEAIVIGEDRLALFLAALLTLVSATVIVTAGALGRRR